jgi:hypothetical protein
MTLALTVMGCGSDVASKIMCNDQAACLKVAAPLFVDRDASVGALPECCAQVCVLPTLSCDSGFRYLTSQPGYGDCVGGSAQCIVPPDMTTVEQPD